MSISGIKAHLCSPFRFEDKLTDRTIELSTAQKTTSIGLGILLGLLTFGIGGVVAFFVSTAIFKAWKKRHLQAQQSNVLPNGLNNAVQNLFNPSRNKVDTRTFLNRGELAWSDLPQNTVRIDLTSSGRSRATSFSDLQNLSTSSHIQTVDRIAAAQPLTGAAGTAKPRKGILRKSPSMSDLDGAKEKRNVGFFKQRVREFDKNAAPNAVQLLNSMHEKL